MVSVSSSPDSVFAALWNDYTSFNPGAQKIYDLLLQRESRSQPGLKSLANDHIALRTYNFPTIGLEALAKLFEPFGYRKGGEYIFEEKRLRAWHLEVPGHAQPKVFISELEVEKFSPFLQDTLRTAVESVDLRNRAGHAEFLWSRRPWAARHDIYTRLLAESEYAAWMYAFGFRANHFTISFNHLKTFSDLADLNRFIRENGFALNAAGGEIKGTPEVFLEQSSTLAEKTPVEFADGTHEIPACYYEFARRFPMPNGELYQGFITSSADKIFESTNAR